MGCVTKAQHDAYAAACRKNIMNFSACSLSTARICPTGAPPVTIEPGKISVMVLPLAESCGVSAAPGVYPPNKQAPTELTGDQAVRRLQAEGNKQIVYLMNLRTSTTRALRPKIGWGFWVGLGLTGVGVALSLRR